MMHYAVPIDYRDTNSCVWAVEFVDSGKAIYVPEFNYKRKWKYGKQFRLPEWHGVEMYSGDSITVTWRITIK